MSTEATVAPIRADFINRSLMGPGMLNVMKGAIWGNVVAVSQAVGTAWSEKSLEARAQGKAVDVEGIKRLAWTKTKVFWPVIVGTTAAYTLVRGTGDTRGVSGMIKPLAIVGLPAAAYAAYYRSMPPQAVRFGLYSCVLLHVYDRIWKPHGAMMENMPTTKLHRRIW